ncbi:MAG: M23 family metallopeptidase [Candidatus Yanofskybacteria bacterium]|nr:M23 family metallopeptidase [Candidatus Yanofskybacteria bacterium]
MRKVFKSDRVGFFVIMVMALGTVAVKGSSLDQPNIIDKLLSRYVEETAASVLTVHSQNQLADINSVFAQNTYNSHAAVSSTFNTIQENSIVSHGTILTNILDEFSDRGAQIANYTVQEGDTLSFIASDFGVSVNTIIWANNLKNIDSISPGQELKIPPVSGVIHEVKKGDTVSTIAKKYGVDQEKIITFNFLPQEGDLQVGQEIIVPDGKIASPVTTVATSAVKRFANLPNLGDFFMMPTTGRNWGRIHGRNGVDIANSCGTPIYAAADGTVNLAKASGWNGGFGKFVRVTHPNGTQTLYAHASSVLVGIGDYVTRGQQIAIMGTTGRSTGCHLHFEVHGARNPLAKY